MIRTWHIELGFVAGVLTALWVITKGGVHDVIGSAGVLFTFAHGQVSERMAAKQAALVVPDVICWRWSMRYFVAKELCWIAYFLATKSWAPLVGCFLFLAYPYWRQLYRAQR
jgi:hypothetical protein